MSTSHHSFLNGKRYYFLNDINSFVDGTPPVFDCDGGDKEEYIMLRLRLKAGLNLNDLTTLYGESATKNIIKKAPLLKEQGFINFENNIISLSEKGFLLSNSIISELI